jgi:LacI family transcriptional regulator
MLGGRLAANHLVECGHRRVAFVGGPTNVRQVAERYAGAQSALHEHGGRLDLFESQALTITAGRAAGDELLTVPVADRPTAAFCANDLLALGLLQRLMAAGLDVPGDIAIVGYDDIEYASAAAVPLSSIRQPREDLGRTAAELLFEEINDPQHRHRQVLFQPEIIVRESTEGRGHGASNGRLGAELGRRALDTDRAAPAAG